MAKVGGQPSHHTIVTPSDPCRPSSSTSPTETEPGFSLGLEVKCQRRMEMALFSSRGVRLLQSPEKKTIKCNASSVPRLDPLRWHRPSDLHMPTPLIDRSMVSVMSY